MVIWLRIFRREKNLDWLTDRDQSLTTWLTDRDQSLTTWLTDRDQSLTTWLTDRDQSLTTWLTDRDQSLTTLASVGCHDCSPAHQSRDHFSSPPSHAMERDVAL